MTASALFNIIQISRRFSQWLNFLNIWVQVHLQTYLHEKGSCPNWQYWKLGTKKFLLFSLIFFHQLRDIITERLGTAASLILYFFTWVMIKQRSATATISTNLFLVFGITSNCANTIKHRPMLWRSPPVRTFAIHES